MECTLSLFYVEIHISVILLLIGVFSSPSRIDKFLIRGVKINTPHYLAKIEGITKGVSTYTVIVSQLESLSTIYYSLRVSRFMCIRRRHTNNNNCFLLKRFIQHVTFHSHKSPIHIYITSRYIISSVSSN